jgi:hypothetical protein
MNDARHGVACRLPRYSLVLTPYGLKVINLFFHTFSIVFRYWSFPYSFSSPIIEKLLTV